MQGFECDSGISCARVLNIPRYGSNNTIIIIVTNVVVLEFLPAQFVYPGAQ